MLKNLISLALMLSSANAFANITPQAQGERLALTQHDTIIRVSEQTGTGELQTENGKWLPLEVVSLGDPRLVGVTEGFLPLCKTGAILWTSKRWLRTKRLLSKRWLRE
jgi:hypothetical protein